MLAAAAPVHTSIAGLTDLSCFVMFPMSFEMSTTSGSYPRISSTFGSNAEIFVTLSAASAGHVLRLSTATTRSPAPIA
jgi:hypothetical protein